MYLVLLIEFLIRTSGSRPHGNAAIGARWRFYVKRRENAIALHDHRAMAKKSIITPSVFSRRLHAVRQLRNIPQDKLGVLAGLEESSSSARISRYESGIHEPPYQFAQALARVLGVSTAYFYCDDDALAEFLLIYSSAAESERRLMLARALAPPVS